jgi:replication factor C small subunit
MSVEQLMWVEKYRPRKLDELVNQEEVKERLSFLLRKKEELPHLLFAGPPGSGKTTTALIVARETLGEYWQDYTLSLNASDERGIDMIRERVKTFARYSDRREGVPFRLVILDEADEMTSDAQTALRRIMEEASAYTRFILICNYSSGIIEPIQSRCAIFRFKRLDSISVTSYLKMIAEKEGIKVSGQEVYDAIYDAVQGDLRQAINMMQAASASGEIDVEKVKRITGATIRSRVLNIMQLAISGKFEEARLRMLELTKVYGLPERDFLRYASEAVSSLPEANSEIYRIIAEYDYRLVVGAQPEIQITAMLSELSSLKRKA